MAAPAQLTPEPERLYRIGDVSRLTDTKPFVLRFWETEFPMLQPVKAPKGHRLYRQVDIDLIRAIKRLLYEEGFTIAGARRHLTEMIASGEELARWLEGPVGATRAAAPNDVANSQGASAGDSLPLFRPDEAGRAAYEQQQIAASPTPDAYRALLAARDELRAILTLLRSE